MSLAYAVYYLICFPVFFNMERQGIAVLFIWISFRYIREKRIFPFLLCVILATGYHNTAIIFVLMYCINLLSNNKLSKFFKLLFSILAVIVFLFMYRVIEFVTSRIGVLGGYSGYLDGKIGIEATKTLIYLGIIIVPALFIKWFITKTKENNVLVYICLLEIVVFVLSSVYVSIGSRMIFYPMLGIFYLVGNVYKTSNIKTNKQIYFCYFVGAALFYFVRIYYIFGQSEIFPYTTIFAK